jgi:hypothetical protein
MKKPSVGTSMGLAGVIAGAAGVLATLAVAHILSLLWTYVALGLAVGIAAVAYVDSVFDRRKTNVSSSSGNYPQISSSPDAKAGTRPLPEGEQTGLASGNGHGNPRAPARTTQPGQNTPPRTVSGTGQWIRPDIDASLPLIEECLELRLDGAGLHSQRVTRGEREPDDEVRVPLPSREMMQSYRQALGQATGCGGPPDEGAVTQARSPGDSLQEMLLRAVPESVRRRLATASTAQPRQLVAIQLKLHDRQLEWYPWELIADPEALRISTAGVTVWRSVRSPLRPVYRSWTGNLLLTGTVLPLRHAPPIDDELTRIKSDLDGCGSLRVCLRPGMPASFGSLLAEYSPAAFHLAAQESDSRPPPGADALPGLIAPGLKKAGTWLAVFSCRDSATMPRDGSRPPGYQIADVSGAAVIGMAGPVSPYPGVLFATALYRCLASGFSALHAYHEAVCRIRHQDPHSTMWSVPVMYAETSNVVPFPVSDEARTRLSLVHFRLHAQALDHELEALAHGNIQNGSGWFKRTATPSVRTRCVTKYLAAVVADQAGQAGGHRQQHVAKAQQDLEEALSATRDTLRQLSRTPDVAGRRRALNDLNVRRVHHQMILERLDQLIGDVG